MDNEKKNELQNEIKNSTFVEKGEVSVEAVSEGPKAFVEDKVAKDEGGVDVKKDSAKAVQKPTPTGEKGLGYEVGENINRNVTKVLDISNANDWIEEKERKKAA